MAYFLSEWNLYSVFRLTSEERDPETSRPQSVSISTKTSLVALWKAFPSLSAMKLKILYASLEGVPSRKSQIRVPLSLGGPVLSGLIPPLPKIRLLQMPSVSLLRVQYGLRDSTTPETAAALKP